ncbi:carbohydrate porin [Variovorax saccharolyticus]|uniref:carbohydrate porin n=1 Tax=Variovorax saccharolyticus TaxID=3053516 RepID=UPI002577CD48|nr:carbohydrate porin [Variovorax sp. J31P216]MDM0028852.1 carbohydrate porin [Variovorax sp. J31P216]
MGVLAALGLSIGASGARADQAVPGSYLLGDWGGQRTRLEDQGVRLSFEYGSQVAHNFSGGSDRLTRYADQWMFQATVDMQKRWGWKGATFQGTITDRNGRNLGADAKIGNSMLLQEIYGRGQTWHLTQFWVNQRLLDDRLQVKFGRLTVGEDFASFLCDFQNLTFCGSQPGNLVSNYWVNWPTSQWALRVKVQSSERTYLQSGVYQVNPRYVEDDYARRSGWTLGSPSGTTGALIPLELGWQVVPGGRSGSYKVGAWYNTSDGADLYDDTARNSRGLTGLDPLQHSGQYGAYLNFQQQITGTGEGRGASVFLNITQTDRRTAVLDRQIAFGVVYQGPFGQVRDAIGLAMGATHNNARHASHVRDSNARTSQAIAAGGGNEYAIEAYYTWAPLPGLYVRPNVQYIVHPGGTSANRNAFVLGLKTQVSF